jgi:putative aldouronate transport system substrate-binding protein
MYLGSTLSFVKSQAFEFQCTHEVGKEGAGKISTAIGLGTIKHPELAITENPWYTSVPTVLPNTKVENDELNTFTELTANGKFNLARDGENVFVDIIVKGFTLDGMTSPEEAATTVDTDWFGFDYLLLKGDAWARLLDYYTNL